MQPRSACLPLLPLRNRGDSGDKPVKPSNDAGLRQIGQRGQSGDIVGTKWGHFYMMKIHSIIHIPRLPTPAARPGPGLAFAGLSCTCLEMGAKRPSPGAHYRAVACPLISFLHQPPELRHCPRLA